MTRLAKPLKRRTTWVGPWGVTQEVVITLYPGGVIGLREARRRKEVQLNAATLYVNALLAEARAARKRKKGAK
jgi:hypothetical protein